MTPQAIDIEQLSKTLQRSIFKAKIHYYESIDSTNILLKTLAAGGAPEGTLAVAEEQTAGRGRMSRQWMSRRGKNLLFSILLRPDLPAFRVFALNMALALAACESIETYTGLRTMIKWPNDIYKDNKKLGGILTEFSVKGDRVEYVILGIGLNVHWNPLLDDKLLYSASSIFMETGRKISREKLLSMILIRLDGLYRSVLINGEEMEEIYRRWNKRSLVTGREIAVLTGNEKVYGTGVGIDDNGSLILLTRDGRKKKFLCGDVSVRMGLT